MRKKIVAGNWKMNTNLTEGIELAKAVNKMIEEARTEVNVIIAPPFTHLAEINKILTVVGLSAQNCASEIKGAYTGEVSVEMIKSTGAKYVIIGHSERRTYYGETDNILAKKINLALEHNLIPIYCIGEVLTEREAGRHFEVVTNQLADGIFQLTPVQLSGVIIAYEPVWAIGTGVNATPFQAQEMHSFIRKEISKKYHDAIASEIPVLYGGSCKGSNAAELFANPDVDGGLIGGASLKADEFLQIVKAFK